MKKQILKIFSGIMCVFSILATIRVDAVRFRIKTRKGIEGKYYILLLDRSRVTDGLLGTDLTVEDPTVLLWNGCFIDIRDKQVLKMLRNLIREGSPFDEDYYDKLEQIKAQDELLYNYLKRRMEKKHDENKC